MNHRDLPAPRATGRFTREMADAAIAAEDLDWSSAWIDLAYTLAYALSDHHRAWSWEACTERADEMVSRWAQ